MSKKPPKVKPKAPDGRGRPRVPRYCPKCGHQCESARGALAHCAFK